MADFGLPILGTDYINFLAYLKARDIDIAQMFSSLPTNPVANMMRFNRSPNKFQQYSAGSWQDILLSIAGGGTGAATAGDARTNLGLGTIATQDANNVAITGGSLSGVSANANIITAGNLAVARLPLSGTWTLSGRLLITGHEVRHDALGANYRTGGSSTLTDTDYVYECTGGAVTFPSAVGCGGRIYIVKRTTSSVTFATTSSQTINGSSAGDFSLTADHEAWAFQSNGANWIIIGTTGTMSLHNKQYTASFGLGDHTINVDVSASSLGNVDNGILHPLGPFTEDHNTGSNAIAAGFWCRFTSTSNVRVQRQNSGPLLAQDYYFSLERLR